MTVEQFGVVINPHSKKNKRRPHRVERLQAIVGPYGIVRETRSLDELGDTLVDFRRRGLRYWVSDGGDGALHWLINKGLETAPDDPGFLPCALPTNGGTIDFVARKVGIVGHSDAILRRLTERCREGATVPTREVDSLEMTGTRVVDGREVPYRRLAFAAALAGVARNFFDLYYAAPTQGPVTIAKILACAARSIILGATPLARIASFPPRWTRYIDTLARPEKARVHIDGRELPWTEYTALNVGAFKINTGGVVKVFTHAGNGKMHVIAGKPGHMELLADLPMLLTGGKLREWNLWDGPATSLEVDCPEGLDPVLDGEFLRGVRSMRIRPGPKIRIARVSG